MSTKMDGEVAAYFSSLSFPSRKIIKEENCLVSYFGNRWDSLTLENKDELIDDWFVDKEVRKKYEEAECDVTEFPSSFPRLMIPSGEKIMVDESDLRTWRDAHSGPFSWKSKSQQDLSLDDFEPDVISKPPPKGKRAKGGVTNETDSNEQDKMAASEFNYNNEPWTDAMLAEFRNYLDTEVIRSRSASPLEEVNEAFEGSTQNLTCSASQSQSNIVCEVSSQNTESRDAGESQNEASQISQKTKPLKSSKKISKSRSFNKNENSDTKQKLIKDQENEESKQAFCNPAMVTEWSTFVGQESQTREPVVNEPPVLTMDRGGGVENSSTDTSPDHSSHLLDSDRSDKPSPDHTSHLIASDHSTVTSPETSPDHTTQLLPNQIAEEEKDEILTVTVSNTEFESDLPRTGFDFLDNW